MVEKLNINNRRNPILPRSCQISKYFKDRKVNQVLFSPSFPCYLLISDWFRSHLLTTYSCEANNSIRQPPLVVRISIDMYLRPLEVTLIGNNHHFSAGKRYNITCESRGSRPPAIISWWKVSHCCFDLFSQKINWIIYFTISWNLSKRELNWITSELLSKVLKWPWLIL